MALPSPFQPDPRHGGSAPQGLERRCAPTATGRVAWRRPVIAPATLRSEVPLGRRGTATVARGRREVASVLQGTDDRLVAVVGPCSVHHPGAALEYARHLERWARAHRDTLCVVMRVYLEKPRSTLGWKGLINDPHLDGSFQVAQGLRTARRLLADIVELGLPVGCEFLDPLVPQYLADAVSWGAIGARTAESPVHRQLVSGLSMPVGIKNSTEGNVEVAIDALRAAGAGHVVTGITDQGTAAVFSTTGNPDTHVVLRGGRRSANCDPASVAAALSALGRAGLPQRLMVDASHGNSGKDHRRQPGVASDLAARHADGEQGMVGVLLESFMVAGRQELVAGQADRLVYGQSITDACMDWSTTKEVLARLDQAVRRRRSR